jgi:hypothetical protein
VALVMVSGVASGGSGQEKRYAGSAFAFRYAAGTEISAKTDADGNAVVFAEDRHGPLVAMFFIRSLPDEELENPRYFVDRLRRDLTTQGWSLDRRESKTRRRFGEFEIDGIRIEGELARRRFRTEVFTVPILGGIFVAVAQYARSDERVAELFLTSLLGSMEFVSRPE